MQNIKDDPLSSHEEGSDDSLISPAAGSSNMAFTKRVLQGVNLLKNSKTNNLLESTPIAKVDSFVPRQLLYRSIASDKVKNKDSLLMQESESSAQDDSFGELTRKKSSQHVFTDCKSFKDDVSLNSSHNSKSSISPFDHTKKIDALSESEAEISARLSNKTRSNANREKDKSASCIGDKPSQDAVNMLSKKFDTPKPFATYSTSHYTYVPMRERKSLDPSFSFKDSTLNSRTTRSEGATPVFSKGKKPWSQVKSADRFQPWKPSQFSRLPPYDHLLRAPFEGQYIDSHCHIDFLFSKLAYKKPFTTFQKEYQETFLPNYGGCIAIFCDPLSFSQKSEWISHLECPNVWASFGCHPHMANEYTDDEELALKAALNHSRVVALGEIGLDYSHKNNVEKEIQQFVFRQQLAIALQKKLPLVIHCRDAFEDTFRIMKEVVPQSYRIHLHCFTGEWSEAKQWLETFPTLRIGLTPVVTFPSATNVHEVAKCIPLDRLLLETDSPYFLPRKISSSKPLKCSHPGLAIHVAAQVAVLKDVSLQTVLQATRENTREIYNI